MPTCLWHKVKVLNARVDASSHEHMSLARGMMGQFEVVHALALRETRTRFGAHRLGYAWALLEPVVMIGTFIGVFALANRPGPEGMTLFGFLATGLVPYTLFSNSVTQVANAIAGNKPLLFYPKVLVLDLVIARALLELGTYFIVFIALLGGHALWSQELKIDEPLLVISGMVLAGLLGTVFGLVFCGLGQYSNLADRARGPLIRPFFWVSGIFFTASQLPEAAQNVLKYNPVVHPIEMVRAGWFESYDADFADPGYVMMFILIVGFIGLALERTVRRRIDFS